MEECLKPSIAQRIDDQHNQLYHKEVASLFKQMKWFVKYLSRCIERVPQTDIDRRLITGRAFDTDRVWKISIVVPIHSKRIVRKLNNILDAYEEIQILDARARTERNSLVDAFLDQITTELQQNFISDQFHIHSFQFQLDEEDTPFWRIFTTDASLNVSMILVHVEVPEDFDLSVSEEINDPVNDSVFIPESITAIKPKRVRGKKARKAKREAAKAAREEARRQEEERKRAAQQAVNDEFDELDNYDRLVSITNSVLSHLN